MLILNILKEITKYPEATKIFMNKNTSNYLMGLRAPSCSERTIYGKEIIIDDMLPDGKYYLK